EQQALTPLRPTIATTLAHLGEAAPATLQALRRSAEHAEAIERLISKLRESGLFSHASLAADLARWVSGEPTAPLVTAWVNAAPTLDEAVRLTERLQAVPRGLGETVVDAAQHQLAWSEAERAILAGACAARIRH